MARNPADAGARIGAVPYLNALPLVKHLSLPVTYAVPAVLERQITSGELDIALLSSFTFLSDPSLIPLYDAGMIQSDGPVESVLLFYKDTLPDPSAIRTVALTPESRTSVALFHVMWRFLWNRSPADLALVAAHDADGILEIGDRALNRDPRGYKVLDMGAAWKDWTGLPFVYAFWMARTEPSEPVLHALIQAKKDGQTNIEEIIRSVKDWPESLVRPYLTRSILYEKTPQSLEGLRLFQDYCVKAALLEKPRNLA